MSKFQEQFKLFWC